MMWQYLPIATTVSILLFIFLIYDLFQTVKRNDRASFGSTTDQSIGVISPFVIELPHAENTAPAMNRPSTPSWQLADCSPALSVELHPKQFAKRRIHIITHTDFDGFLSGALLLRSLGAEANIVFSGPRWLHQTVIQLMTSLAAEDAVVIADLGIGADTYPKIVPVLQQLRRRKISLYWYDHHQWAEDHLHEIAAYCQDLIVDIRFKTAAEIIRRRLLQEDDYADQLISFIRNQTAESAPEWDTAWRSMLSELQDRASQRDREEAIRKFAFNQPLTISDALVQRRGVKRKAYTAEVAGNNHALFTTTKGLRFIVIDVRSLRYEVDEQGRRLFVMQSKKPMMTIGQLACDKHQADFCLVIWSNEKYSLYRGINPRIDFSSWLGDRFLPPYHYRVAGHRYAAGVTTSLPLRYKFLSLFLWHLPPHVKRLIKALREEF